MIRRWVETWKQAGPLLEAIRLEEVRNADNLEDLAVLEGAFNHAPQSFEELLLGVGVEGSRAHTLTDACTIP